MRPIPDKHKIPAGRFPELNKLVTELKWRKKRKLAEENRKKTWSQNLRKAHIPKWLVEILIK